MADREQQLPDSSEPSDERQAELETAYEAQKDTDAPYKDVSILTVGEVLWIMAQRHGSVEYFLYGGMTRVNLSKADLRYANLSGIILSYVNLSEADLGQATMTGANLIGTLLSGAILFGTNLSGAILSYANLSGTTLIGANLSGAILDPSFRSL